MSADFHELSSKLDVLTERVSGGFRAMSGHLALIQRQANKSHHRLRNDFAKHVAEDKLAIAAADVRVRELEKEISSLRAQVRIMMAAVGISAAGAAGVAGYLT